MGKLWRVVRGVPWAVFWAGMLGLAEVAWGQEIQVTNYGEMPPVILHHGKHADSFTCETCHHPERSGGAHRCGYCHRDEARGKVATLHDAAHKEGVGKCWACHFKQGARKKLDCDSCHRGGAKAAPVKAP